MNIFFETLPMTKQQNVLEYIAKIWEHILAGYGRYFVDINQNQVQESFLIR